MHEKGQEIEEKKVVGQVVLSMAKIMFQMVALVLEGVKAFIFDLPSSPSALDQFNGVVFVHFNVSHPGVMVGGFPVLAYHGVLQEVDVIGLRLPIKRDMVGPLIAMGVVLVVSDIQKAGFSHAGKLIDPFKKHFVIGRLGHQDKRHFGEF